MKKIKTIHITDVIYDKMEKHDLIVGPLIAFDIKRNGKLSADVILSEQGFRFLSKGIFPIKRIKQVNFFHESDQFTNITISTIADIEWNRMIKQEMPVRYWLGLTSVSKDKEIELGGVTTTQDQMIFKEFLTKFRIPFVDMN